MPSVAAKRCSSSYDVSLARCDHSRPCPGEFGGSISSITRSAVPAAQVGGVVEQHAPGPDVAGLDVRLPRPTGPRGRRHLELAARRRAPARARARPAVPRRPSAAGRPLGRTPARSVSSSCPTVRSRDEPAESTVSTPGSRLTVRQARAVSSEASIARWNVQGTPANAPARCSQTSTSTLRSASRKPNDRPFDADVDVVLAQPDQPGQLAARGGVGVVEPEHRAHRQVGLLAHRGHQGRLRRQPAGLDVCDHQQPVGAPLVGGRDVARMQHHDLE